jgi:hypothetical protein
MMIVFSTCIAASVAVSQEAPERPEGGRFRVRIAYPWNRVNDLTQEQRLQILTIRQQIADSIRDLRDQERTRCLAVLNVDQQARLEQALADDAAARKAERARRTEAITESSPSTQPAR